jgi:uncharacterized protein
MTRTSPSVSRRLFLLGTLASGAVPLAYALVAPYGTGAAPAGAALRPAASLGPLINIPQTWNNCGPAAIAEVLAYWGIARTQGEVQATLRVDGPVVGMTPYGVRAYARSVGLRALMGVGGTDRLIKLLVAAGLPPIVHQVVSLSDSVGHWRPIESYDDQQGVFVTSDPYLGPNYRIGYAAFDQMWAQRAYSFVVLYPASRHAALAGALATAGWNKVAAYTHDLARVRAYQEDVTPTGAPASASSGYHYLALAWDSAQLGQSSAARAYLQQAARAGANPIQVWWINAEIG